MGKTPTRCVHCLQLVDKTTKDHLFPKSWYPATTPANLEKWTIPACESCNREYGRIEEGLRLMLAACLDPKSLASAGLWQKASGSINPAKGKSAADAFKRKLARRRFLKTLMPADSVVGKRLLNEINPDRPKGSYALTVKGADINRFIAS